MLDYSNVKLSVAGFRLRWVSIWFSLPPAFAVLDPLLALAFLCAVIGHAAARGAPPAVCLSAAKGTAQVLALPLIATGVAWMGQEEDAAMLALSQAALQVGMGSQDRPQDGVILKDESADLTLVVPVRPELKMPLDPYGKKPRVSLRMLMRTGCLTAAALVPYM